MADKQRSTRLKQSKDTKSLPQWQFQRFSDYYIGDCFRACIANLLKLPIDVLPNDHSPAFFLNWEQYLSQFGLALSHSIRSDGPLWASEPWIADVVSKNYKDTMHAILMHRGGRVLFDPSRKNRYRKGEYLHSDVVRSGHHLRVVDTSLLHRLNEYRQRLLAESVSDLQLNNSDADTNVTSKAQS